MITPDYLWTQSDYGRLHSLVFRDDYPGYKPETKEIPNGDGVVDADKRYAHVVDKYLSLNTGENRALRAFLMRATMAACDLARFLVPPSLMPSYVNGALRVLDYPVGAQSAPHTDFDLFTITLYRNIGNVGLGATAFHWGEMAEVAGIAPAARHSVHRDTVAQNAIVYFAIPDYDAELAPGVRVEEWLKERYARSRVNG